ncbi:hypothetical protein ATPR_2502 [Acetobacter tropicalis NBRC 101654]|uniref:Uncharacterized protein n=1 Tax=Acetobacter tropicalis NBRC 101654 TaxID=749388 RepID=F7VGK3_9PROT|nr:hypothetical protein ATPR_2502 [Acetobacter tropicalis NBRC 101654]
MWDCPLLPHPFEAASPSPDKLAPRESMEPEPKADDRHSPPSHR